jgi:hypothetical protein
MPNEVLRKVGDHILFAHEGVNPISSGLLTTNYTRYGIPLHDLANATSVQSAKADLGTRRAPAYNVTSAIHFATAPTAGAAVEYYWAPSTSTTVAVGNVGGVSGASGVYAGGPGGTDDAGVKQMQFIGQLACQAITASIQIGNIGTFSPASRAGSLVVKNECGQAVSTSVLNQQVLFEQVIDEVQ